MIEPTTPAASPARPARTLAVYASLWVVSVALGMSYLGPVLLQIIFASLTLALIGRALVTETRTLRPGGLTWRAGLLLGCWGFFIVLTGLRPLWMNVMGLLFAPR